MILFENIAACTVTFDECSGDWAQIWKILSPKPPILFIRIAADLNIWLRRKTNSVNLNVCYGPSVHMQDHAPTAVIESELQQNALFCVSSHGSFQWQ